MAQVKVDLKHIKNSRRSHIAGIFFSCPACKKEILLRYPYCSECGIKLNYSQSVETIRRKEI